jgi:hypothetical protein
MKAAMRFLFILGLAWGMTAQTGGETAADAELSWPREYVQDAGRLLVYQPQIDEWEGQRKLRARSAVSLTPAGEKKPHFGAVSMEAETNIDTEDRTVYIHDLVLLDLTVPAPDEATSRRLEALVRELFPDRSIKISIDRLLAYVDRGEVNVREVKVNLDPPPIFHSSRPAVLVMFDGKPIESDIDGTALSFVVNTNWDVLRWKQTGDYYLLDEDMWLKSQSVEGPWAVADSLPSEFDKLPNDDNWKDVRAQLSGFKTDKALAPTVFVSYRPAELIVTDGDPQFEEIPGTYLMAVSNTEADIFFHTKERMFYFLTAGRWFRSAAPKDGEWEPATTDLPADFAKIPADHERANVRASVAGTTEAEDAVLLASVPQTATISRSEAAAEVTYFGTEAQFEPIEGTALEFAVNTPQDVIKGTDGKYYLCEQGVWFYADKSDGPWELCDKVAPEIYTIPADHEKHNVTYVQTYESTSETVVYGYTGGYSGTVVSIGLCFWGGGWYYPPYYWRYGPFPYPYYWPYHRYAYGVGAAYNPMTGTYFRGARAYGPYGGIGRGAAYNPRTGAWYRGGGAWGPGGAAWRGFGYNPRTGEWRSAGVAVDRWNDAYAAGRRGGNEYARWGEAVVGQGDDWAHLKGARNENRGVLAGENSEGGKAVIGGDGDSRRGLAKDEDNNVYAGKDGNVYKRDEDGNWSKRGDDGDWNDIPSDQVDARRQEAQQRREEGGASTRERAQNVSPEQREQLQSRAQNASPEQREQARSQAQARTQQRSGSELATSGRAQPGPTRADSSALAGGLQRDYNARVKGQRRSNQYRSYSGSHQSRGRSASQSRSTRTAPRGGGMRRRR